MKGKYIGKKTKLDNSMDVALEYKKQADNDMKAAELLRCNGLYNEATYYYIQTMEKRIKAKICNIVDITNPYFSERMRSMGHSLEGAIEFLVEILSGGNKVFYDQLIIQIVKGVLKDIDFSKLHNNVRYPAFNSYREEYSSLEIQENECDEIRKMVGSLEVYLKDLERIK